MREDRSSKISCDSLYTIQQIYVYKSNYNRVCLHNSPTLYTESISRTNLFFHIFSEFQQQIQINIQKKWKNNKIDSRPHIEISSEVANLESGSGIWIISTRNWWCSRRGAERSSIFAVPPSKPTGRRRKPRHGSDEVLDYLDLDLPPPRRQWLNVLVAWFGTVELHGSH